MLRSVQRLCKFRHLSSLSSVSGDIARVALLGPPGSGKTTLGRRLAKRLHLPFIDADDDILQPAWGRSVAEELKAIGPNAFLKKEGETCIAFDLPDRCILSLTGSNPLHEGFMDHIKTRAVLVYLDVDPLDILRRLGRMKVDRIVGQAPGRTMAEVLSYRRSFYERCHHLRVLCGSEENVDKMMERLIAAVFGSCCRLRSTRSASEGHVSFGAAMRVGLAPDGGLFTPQRYPMLDRKQWLRLVPLSFAERCERVLQPWIARTDMSAMDLREAIIAAYHPHRWTDPAICPVRHLEGRTFVQELFHGPTASFKDLPLALMAECLPRMKPQPQLLFVATSGDTGSAVLSAFGRQGWPVVVVYPRDGVSTVQRLCMTQFHDEKANRLVCGLGDDFDACQALVKAGFARPPPMRELLNGANSINWGRLLTQVAFHCSGYLEMVRQGNLRFGDPLHLAIPSGNFGDALSAFYAKQMGLPLGKILCANNDNSVLADFFSSGCLVVRSRTLIRSISPAIDILRPSNLERLIAHFDPRSVSDLYSTLDKEGVMRVSKETLGAIQQHFVGASIPHDTVVATIADVFKRTGYLLDPHSAVGAAARSILDKDDTPILLTATAHPAKFAESVVEAVEGNSIEDPFRAIAEIDRISKGSPGPHPALQTLASSRRERTWRPEEVTARVESILEQLKVQH